MKRIIKKTYLFLFIYLSIQNSYSAVISAGCRDDVWWNNDWKTTPKSLDEMNSWFSNRGSGKVALVTKLWDASTNSKYLAINALPVIDNSYIWLEPKIVDDWPCRKNDGTMADLSTPVLFSARF